MRKIRKAIFWIIVTMAVLTAGSLVATAVTAQAAPQTTRNSVYFASVDSTLSQKAKIAHFTSQGQMILQKVGTTRVKVNLVCPARGNHQLVWSLLGDKVLNVVPTGQCFRVPQGKHIQLSVLAG